MAIATFGAGCFWHVQDEFDRISGVLKTQAGYAGGRTKNPTYEEVCTDETGHAEVVQLEYDPKVISYQQLLSVFWSIHDPTQINRQGLDIGTQYRSLIIYHTVEQKKIAELSKKQQEKLIGKNLATEIKKAAEFYPAEEYHQHYIKKTGRRVC